MRDGNTQVREPSAIKVTFYYGIKQFCRHHFSCIYGFCLFVCFLWVEKNIRDKEADFLFPLNVDSYYHPGVTQIIPSMNSDCLFSVYHNVMRKILPLCLNTSFCSYSLSIQRKEWGLFFLVGVKKHLWLDLRMALSANCTSAMEYPFIVIASRSPPVRNSSTR